MSQFSLDQDSGGAYNPFEASGADQAAADAVPQLQLPLASRGQRLGGSIIDSLLGALAVLPGLFIMGAGLFSMMAAAGAAGGPGGGSGLPPGMIVEGDFPGAGSELSAPPMFEGSDADGLAGPGGVGGAGLTGPGAAPPLPLGSLLGGLAVMGVSVLVIFGLQIYLLWTRSQSVGKICMGTLIVDQRTGKRAGAVSCILLRFIVHTLITSIPNIGSVYGLVDALFIFRQDRRCLHDMIASTVVVQLPR
jgi:uncharacterized RDD family membrane protein YckC